MDGKAFIKPNRLVDKSIEVLITRLYSSSSLSEINPRIVSISCANFFNQFKIFSTILFILEHPNLKEDLKNISSTKDIIDSDQNGLPLVFPEGVDFPPFCVVDYPKKVEDYSEVYTIVSCKAIKLLSCLVDDHGAFFMDEALDEEYLTHIESILQLRIQLGEFNPSQKDKTPNSSSTTITSFMRLFHLFEL